VGKVGVFNITLGDIDVYSLGSIAAYAVAPYMVHVSTDKGPAVVHGAMTFIFERAGTGWSIIHTHASTKVDTQ
jgi:ketosteroid isomerase-like protein